MSQIQNPEQTPEPTPTPPPPPTFDDKVNTFAQQRQGRRFYTGQENTIGDQEVAEAKMSAGMAQINAMTRGMEEAQNVQRKVEDPKNKAVLETEMFQRDIQLQARNERERLNSRFNIIKDEYIDLQSSKIKKVYADPDLSESEKHDETQKLRKLTKKHVSTRYELDDVVREGRVYNPNQFVSVPVQDDDGNYVGRARLNRKHFDQTGDAIPNSVTKKELDEMGHKANEGEFIMFDQNSTPKQVFSYLNRNGDGTKLAQYAKHLHDLDILYKREDDSLTRLGNGLSYILNPTDGVLSVATTNQIGSVISVVDDLIGGRLGFDLMANRREFANVFFDDFATQAGSAVAQALPALTAVAGTALITRNPFATGTVARAGLTQLAGRAILNGTKGMFFNGMAYLAYKGDFEAEYLKQGLTPEQAKQNAYLDAGAGMLATVLSTKLLAGTTSFLFKNQVFRDTFIQSARFKTAHIMGTGFTREAIQEGMDEAFHTALTAVADRADLFGDREDGDFLIGARELLLAATAGGVIGGTFGAALDMVSVTNAIDAEFKRGKFPTVGQEARYPDGTPMGYVDGKDFFDAKTGEKIDNPDAVDPNDEAGRTFRESRSLRQGKVAKVTEANQGRFKREWERKFYQNFVRQDIEESQTAERHQFLKAAVDQLRAFSEGKGVDVDMFGNPTEVYKGKGPAKGQRKIDLASMDAELAYSLAGRTPPNEQRLGENQTDNGTRGFEPLQGDSRKDFERAGLGWLAKGLNQEQRATLRARAQESVTRLENRTTRQDARTQELLDQAQKAYGGSVPLMVEAKVRAQAERDVDAEIARETSAMAWLGRAKSGDSRYEKVGPRKPHPGTPSAEGIIQAANEARLPLPKQGDTDFREERVADPATVVAGVVNRAVNAGKVKGESVPPPTELAQELQDAMAQAGVPVVFVTELTGDAAVRDADTGVILVNAKVFAEAEAATEANPEMQRRLDAMISSVFAHEFTHTLQAEHPQAYAALVQGLGDANPDLMMRAAKEFLRRRAQAKAKSQGINLPENQDFTDAEALELLKEEPGMAKEIAPYAVELLVGGEYTTEGGFVQESTEAEGVAANKSQMSALANAFRGMKRNKFTKMVFRLRNMFSSFRAHASLSKAWKSMKSWDALIDAFEMAGAEGKAFTDQALAGKPRPQLDSPDARGPPALPEGDTADAEGAATAMAADALQDAVDLDDAETLAEGLNAAFAEANAVDSIDAIAERKAADLAPQGQQMEFDFPDEAPSRPAFEGRGAPASVETRVDTMDRVKSGARKKQAEELGDQLRTDGKFALDNAIFRAKARSGNKIPGDILTSPIFGENLEGIADDIGLLQDVVEERQVAGILNAHLHAAGIAERLTNPEPTREQVVRNMIEDMLAQDPEGYEGIMSDLIRYARDEGGMSQLDAENFVVRAKNKQFIQEDEVVFEESGQFANVIENQLSDYDPKEVKTSDEHDFDDGEFNSDSSLLKTNFTKPFVPEKVFRVVREQAGKPKIKVQTRGSIKPYSTDANGALAPTPEELKDAVAVVGRVEFNLNETKLRELEEKIQAGNADASDMQLAQDLDQAAFAYMASENAKIAQQTIPRRRGSFSNIDEIDVDLEDSDVAITIELPKNPVPQGQQTLPPYSSLSLAEVTAKEDAEWAEIQQKQTEFKPDGSPRYKRLFNKDANGNPDPNNPKTRDQLLRRIAKQAREKYEKSGLVLPDTFQLRIVMNNDGTIIFTNDIAGNHDVMADIGMTPFQTKLVMGHVERTIQRMSELGWGKREVNYSTSTYAGGRSKTYRRFAFTSAGRLHLQHDNPYFVYDQAPIEGGTRSTSIMVEPTPEVGDTSAISDKNYRIQNMVDNNNRVIDGIRQQVSGADPTLLTDPDWQSRYNDVKVAAKKIHDIVQDPKYTAEYLRDPNTDHEADFEEQKNARNSLVDSINELIAYSNSVTRLSRIQDPRIGARSGDTVPPFNAFDIKLDFVTHSVPKSMTQGIAEIGPKFDPSLLGGNSLLGLLRSRGDLPPKVFNAKFRKDSRIRAAQDQVNFRASQLSSAVDAEYKEAGFSKEQLIQFVDAAMKDTRLMPQLPPRTRAAAEGMRNDIDKMTDLLIDAGAISGDLALSVKANKGFYVHRSYRVFDDPDWAKKVPKDVRNKMKRYLIRTAKADGKTMTDEEAEIVIKQLLLAGRESNSPVALLASGKGGVVADVLKRRGNIPQELRALWGEYDDPNVNYAKSMQKMGQLAATFRFTNEVADAGAGSFIFDEATGDAVIQFPTDKGRYGGLAGKYTTVEFMEAYESAHSPEGYTGDMAALYYRGVAAVKWGKTIGSPMTHVRNMFGNVGFAIANGHIGMGSIASLKSVYEAAPFVQSWRSGNKEKAQQEYNRLVELGVVQGGSVQDIIDLIDQANAAGMDVPQFLRKLQDNDVAKVAGKKAQQLIDAANRLYSFEDDAWKIYAFTFEKKRYEKAYTDAGQEIPANIDEQVAVMIRDTYPNYNMPGRLLRALRRSPFVGTFVSFPFEVLRTGVNRARITANELNDPVLRKIGMKRAMGQLVAYNMGWALARQITALLGIDEDEVSALREMVPPWAQNSPLIVYKNDKGEYTYIDIGYTDPFAYFAKPVQALMRGESFEEAMFGSTDGLKRGAMYEILAPFIEEDMVFGTLLEVYNGKTATGRPIYARADERMTKIVKIAEHIFTDFAPGAYKQLLDIPLKIAQGKTDDYGNMYNFRSHALSIATGFKQQPINPEQAFSFHCRTFAKMEIELRGQLTRVAGRAGTVSERELERAYDTVNAAREQNLQGFMRILRAAERLNISTRRRSELMYSAGIARKRIPAMMRGVHIPVEIDTKFLDRNIRRAALNNPDAPLAQRAEALKRLKTLRSRQRQATPSRTLD